MLIACIISCYHSINHTRLFSICSSLLSFTSTLLAPSLSTFGLRGFKYSLESFPTIAQMTIALPTSLCTLMLLNYLYVMPPFFTIEE